MNVRGTLFIVAASLPLFSCAGLGGGHAGAGASAAVEDPFEKVPLEEYEQRLRGIVERELRAARRRPGGENAKVVFKKPYSYREYFEYTEEPDDFTLQFTEKESRTTPLAADFKMRKTRYATRLYRKREDARNDTRFLRGAGMETVSYELRSGRWRRSGSLFVSDRTEEFLDGEWRQIDERPSRAFEIEEEEKRGWWNRLLFWR